MHQPMGFKYPNLPNHVCLLKKSLYGFKQEPRAWYKRFADYIFLLLVFLTVLQIILSLFTEKEQLWLTFFYMWMILY